MQAALAGVAARDPDQSEFLGAVCKVAASLETVFDRRPELLPVFQRMCEPERQLMFRVAWLDDANEIQASAEGRQAGEASWPRVSFGYLIDPRLQVVL